MIKQPNTRAELVDIACVKASAGKPVAVVCGIDELPRIRSLFVVKLAHLPVSVRDGCSVFEFQSGGVIHLGARGLNNVALPAFRGFVLLDPKLRDDLEFPVFRTLTMIAAERNEIAHRGQRRPSAPAGPVAAPPADLEPWPVEDLPAGYGIAKSGAPGAPVLWLTDAAGRPLCRIPDALMKPRTAGPLTHAGTIAAEIWAAARAFEKSNEFAE